MTVIVVLFFIAFLASALATAIAQWKFYRLLESSGLPGLIEPAHIEKPWLWFGSLRRVVNAPYGRYTGDLERARLVYIGWRWSTLAMFVGFLIVSAIFLH